MMCLLNLRGSLEELHYKIKLDEKWIDQEMKQVVYE